MTFNKRSKFVYRTYTYCRGYTIRRSLWKSKIFNDDHEEIASAFKKIIKKDYEETTMNKVIEEKNRLVEKWNDRCDYSGMLRVIYEGDHGHGDEHEDDDHRDEEEEKASISQGFQNEEGSQKINRTPVKCNYKASQKPKTEKSIDEDELG